MKRLPYVLLIPGLLIFAVWSVAPIAIVGQLSFFKTDYLTTVFVGLGNYARVASDAAFWTTVVNGFAYCAMIVPATVILALLLSFALIDTSKAFQSVMRTVLYIPVFASGIILARTWRWIFAGNGIANYALGLVGIEPVGWLLNRWSGISAVSIAMVTTNLGGYVLMLMASMLSIPHELIESARIDGASRWETYRLVYIPMIAPTVAMLTMVLMIGTMQIWETVAYMTAGAPMGGTATMAMDIMATGFQRSDYGLAAAKGVVMIVVILAMAVAKRRIER